MTGSTRLDRRRFLAVSGGALGAALAGVRAGARPLRGQTQPAPRGPAANRVRVGILGFGASGSAIARALASVQGAEVAGVSDLYDGRLRRAREIAGDGVPAVRDWRSLLDRPDIDAVVVATPDHWHVRMVEQAIQAGKDVYCECPVVHRAGQGERLSALAAAARRIVQGGGGWITSPVFAAARDVLASGRIGRVTLVRASWDSSGSVAAWQAPFPPDASADSIDFAAFDDSGRPFDPHRFFRWRCYRDYGSGLAGARFAPQLTAVHWLLGASAPIDVSASGALLRWRDGRDVPDTLQAFLTYPEGFVVALSSSLNGVSSRTLDMIGTDGTLSIHERGITVSSDPQVERYPDVGETWPKEYRDWFYMMHGMTPQGQVRGLPAPERTSERIELPPDALVPPAHLIEFVDCVRTRRQPKESLDIALNAAEAAIRADDLTVARLPGRKEA